MTRFLILCPTYNHQDTLSASLASVQAQTVQDWRLVVIGDGAPDRTREIVAAMAAQDSRITYEQRPKSPRHGEPYRDEVIRAIEAEVVCHVADDDLWLPDRLETLDPLADRADFIAAPPLNVSLTGELTVKPLQVGAASAREALLQRRYVGIGITFVAYRRDAYLSLPNGWETTPQGATDTLMWAKFFADTGLRSATTSALTGLRFADAPRRSLTSAERLGEMRAWLALVSSQQVADNAVKADAHETGFLELFAACDPPPDVDWREALVHCGIAPIPDPAGLPSFTVGDTPLPWAFDAAAAANAERAFRIYAGRAQPEEFQTVYQHALNFPGEHRIWRALIRGVARDDEGRARALANEWKNAAAGRPVVLANIEMRLAEIGLPSN